MSDVTLSVEALAEIITAAYREGQRHPDPDFDDHVSLPVFKSEGKWWFSDDEQTFGPYETAELAERGLETRKGAQKHD